MRITSVLAAAAGCMLAASASADLLAEWTFEATVPTTAGPHIAEGGLFAATSTASGFHIDPSAVYSNPAGNGSPESFSSNFWTINDYYEFRTSTLGFTDITFGFDQTRSSTGPGVFDVAYSLNGTDFTTLVNDYTIDALTWSSIANNPLSTFGPHAVPAVVSDQPMVYFRLINQVTPGGTGGTNRIDNVVVNGTLIPAPGSAALLTLGGLAMLRRRR